MFIHVCIYYDSTWARRNVSLSHVNICFSLLTVMVAVGDFVCCARLLGRALEVLEKVYEPSLLQEVGAVCSIFVLAWLTIP